MNAVRRRIFSLPPNPHRLCSPLPPGALAFIRFALPPQPGFFFYYLARKEKSGR
jgi:hypothetical protein